MNETIGDRLDSLGVRATIPGGALISGAVVLLDVVGDDGTHVSIAWSEGMSWVTRRGLIEVARDMERHDPVSDDEGDA